MIKVSWWSILKLDIEVYVDKLKENKKLRSIAHYDSGEDTIRVSLPKLKRELTQLLGKEPTDEQLERAYTKVMAHESGHAADLGPTGPRGPKHEFYSDDASQYIRSVAEDTELVAYLNQFGENIFSGINRFLQHPSAREIDHEKVKEMNIDPIFAEMKGATKVKDRFKNLEKIVRWAATTTTNNKLRNELVLLELAMSKKFKGKFKANFPINASMARARYKDFDGKVIPKAGRIINQVWGKK